MITLEVMDLDLALRVPKPANLTNKSTSDEKREMEKWEKSNRISLMVTKRAIPKAFRGTMSNQVVTAKAFLEDLEKRFAKNEKAETSTILAKFISMRYTVSTPAGNIIASINSIPMLNGTNFKAWQESVMITLEVMDLDLALRVPKPANLTNKSTSDEKREMEKWEKSNRISLMVTKRAIPKAFRGTMSDQVVTAKAFLEDLEKRFAKNEKAETSTILAKFISMRYTGKGNIREYIMEMSDLVSKLKALKLDLSEDLLVHLVLISLPAQFIQLKVSYNCQKDSWFLNELISHCVQEEDRLKKERTLSANLASTTKDKRKDNKKKKKKEVVETAPQKKQHKEPTRDGCFLCGAEQFQIPDIVQEATPDQDNVIDPCTQTQEVVPEEQTLQPQEPLPLRRSIGELEKGKCDSG
ncbi:hypothetical protein GH714_020841 [Hevea brasiliensis]|uniref:Retrotransposon Copia-like N-terminal domain-containing protein n=1 Tax=Hevea brasiliensis TaxID=3981 RepID=A0A6A6KQF2_HEVBR|nr:hypothetical protein GH714_020841 [Hevea brasiliensis]